MSDVFTSVTANFARIALNRREALHALNTHKCRNMARAQWTSEGQRQRMAFPLD